MNEVQMRRRLHRGARQRANFQRHGQARAGRGPRAPPANDGNENEQIQPEVVQPEVEVPITYTVDDESGLSWNGSQLAERAATHQIGVPVNGNNPYQTGPGKDTGTMADSPIQDLHTPQYVYDSHVVPEKRTRVFRPLITYLNTEIPPSDRAAAQYTKTTLPMGIKRFPGVYDSHPALIHATVEAFIHHSMFVLRRSKNLLQTVSNNDGSELVDTRYEVVDLGHPMVDENVGGVRRIAAVECDLPLEWTVRDDMRVVMSGAWFLDDTGHYRLPQGPGKGHYCTSYLSFRGERMFSQYDNSPNNLVHGLKRVLGARLGEKYFRRNGLLALRAVTDQCAIEVTTNWSGLRALQRNVTLFNRHTEAPPADQLGDPLPPGDYSGAYAFLAKGMADALRDVTYPAIQQLVDVVKTGTAWCMAAYLEFALYVTPVMDRRVYNAQLVHVKQALRKQYVDGVAVHVSEDLMAKRSQLMVKNELGKIGKPPRLFGGFGPGCMTTNELPEFIKKGLCRNRVFVIGAVSISVAILLKPTTSALTTAFEDLVGAMQTPNSICWRIYSDDQVVSGNIGGHTFLINADISSNDSSQGAFGFGLLDAMACQLDPISGSNMCRQNRLPMVAINPANPADKLTIQSPVGFEQSGGINTTTLNHTGSLGIALCAVYLMATRPIRVAADISDCIHQGGALVGHSLTSEWCGDMDRPVIELCQFLKHSPCLTVDGNLIAAQNLGPLLRSIGRVDTEMTSKQLGVCNSAFRAMSNPQRCDAFIGSVVAGHVHDASHPILEALRARFPLTHSAHDPRFLVERDVSGVVLHEEAWCARYDTTPMELEEVAELIRNVKCGQVLHHDLFTRVYKVDYGL